MTAYSVKTPYELVFEYSVLNKHIQNCYLLLFWFGLCLCSNVWLRKCNGILFRQAASVLFQRHEVLQLSHPPTKTTNTKKGLKQMHRAFSALTFFLSHDKYFLSLSQPSWKRDLYSGIKNYDLF